MIRTGNPNMKPLVTSIITPPDARSYEAEIARRPAARSRANAALAAGIGRGLWRVSFAIQPWYPPAREQVLGVVLDDPECSCHIRRSRPGDAQYSLRSIGRGKTLLMSGEGPSGPRRRQRLGSLSVVAGFQPSISGRFWVSTEVRKGTCGGSSSRTRGGSQAGIR
jgi:hypothetical protein